jgi:hypothetical protein
MHNAIPLWGYILVENGELRIDNGKWKVESCKQISPNIDTE